jgi:hypothetical protein
MTLENATRLAELILEDSRVMFSDLFKFFDRFSIPRGMDLALIQTTYRPGMSVERLPHSFL